MDFACMLVGFGVLFGAVSLLLRVFRGPPRPRFRPRWAANTAGTGRAFGAYDGDEI